MRTRSVVPALFIVALLLGCATVGKTPLQVAESTYVTASIDYEAAMTVLSAAREKHLITDAQWAIIDVAHDVAQIEGPAVHDLLVNWRATGQKPTGFDGALGLLTGALNTLTKAQQEVKAVKP